MIGFAPKRRDFDLQAGRPLGLDRFEPRRHGLVGLGSDLVAGVREGFFVLIGERRQVRIERTAELLVEGIQRSRWLSGHPNSIIGVWIGLVKTANSSRPVV